MSSVARHISIMHQIKPHWYLQVENITPAAEGVAMFNVGTLLGKCE